MKQMTTKLKQKAMKNLSAATFNMRGLCGEVKKGNLCKDLCSYMCCIQETKIHQECGETINDYRLISLKTNQKYYENGYLIHKNLEPYAKSMELRRSSVLNSMK